MMMTMRSHSHNVRHFGAALAVLLAFAVVVLGVIFSAPLFSVGTAFVTSLSLSPEAEYQLLPKATLASRLQNAEEELTHIRYQAALTDVFIKENARLLHELSLRADDESGMGRVVGAPPKTHYDTLLVELADGHAVLPGDFALFAGVLVGEAVKVSESAALVRLFSSPGTAIDVSVGTPEAIVVAQGFGGGAFVFDVPRGVAVASGDSVVSATYGGRIVARVRNVVIDPDRTTTRVYANTAAALPDMRFVHFIHPSPEIEEEES